MTRALAGASTHGAAEGALGSEALERATANLAAFDHVLTVEAMAADDGGGARLAAALGWPAARWSASRRGSRAATSAFLEQLDNATRAALEAKVALDDALYAQAARLAAGIAAAGGPVGPADLAGCTAEEVAPLEVPYRGFVLRQTPPNSTGFTFLQIMRMLERFDLAALGRDSAALIHLMVEAKKRAFLDREAHGADPRGYHIPLAHLLSAEHAAAEAASIDSARAAHLPLKPRPGSGDTTYFCVVDAAGNAVSAIQSINSAFGSGSMAGETGVLMNNRMAYWHLEPAHPNRLRPGRRVLR
jgi:gamma-glutamyltranspeptidase/glutathione hydrolase